MSDAERRLADLREEKASLEKLRESGLADRKALDERVDDLDRQIDDAEKDLESKAEEARRDAEDADAPTQDTPRTGMDGERLDPENTGPLDADTVHNFETFPEYRDAPETPPDEPINAWEMDGTSPGRADGGDPVAADSVTKDLGWKPPKGPLSDEAEARIDGAEERLPSLVGEGAGTMGGGLFDGETQMVPPPSPALRVGDGPDGIDDIASRSGGGMPSTLLAVPVAIVFGVLAFLAASRIGAPEVAGTATTAPSAAASASTRPSTTAAGLVSFEYRITPLTANWDGTGILNLRVVANTSAINFANPNDVLTFTWTVDAGTCAKVINERNAPNISVDFINATDARGRLTKCPGGPSYPVTVKLVIRDRWGAQYERLFTGPTGEDAKSWTIGEPISVHHEGQ